MQNKYKYYDAESRESRSDSKIDSMTVDFLHFKIKNNRIDLDPEYQRDIVWNQKKRQSLIETMWKNYPVPMLFMAESPENPDIIESVDGKNRLFAISQYIEGQFKVTKTGYSDIDRKYFHELDKMLQMEFKAKQLQVCTFSKITKEQRRDFFRRIQEGVSLNSMEKLHSRDHALISFIRDHYSQHRSLYNCILTESAQKRFGYQKFSINELAMVMYERMNKFTIAGSDDRSLSWIDKQENQPPTELVQQQFHDCVKAIADLLLKLPVGQQGPPNRYLPPKVHTQFILDIARILIHTSARQPITHTLGVLQKFATQLRLVANKCEDPTLSPYANRYITTIEKGAASAQYSKKVVEDRLETMRCFFTCGEKMPIGSHYS